MYRWGWGQLVSWLSKQKSAAEYLLAAEAMVRQFPHDGVARNHLSSAQLKCKDVKSSKQTLIDAVNVSPDNAFALERLFEAQLKDREFSEAARTLDLIHRHMLLPQFLQRSVMLAASLNDPDTASSALGQLCTAEGFETDALTQAVASMHEAKLHQQINQVLGQAVVDHEDVPAGVVGIWTARIVRQRDWKTCKEVLNRFAPASPQWLEAALAYVDGLTKAKEYSRVNKFIRSQLKRKNLPTRLWGQFGYALFVQDKKHATIRAMQDWAQRKDAVPWMLLNLAHAYRRINEFDAANSVQQSALKRQADHTTLKHQVWLAFDQITAGQQGDPLKTVLSVDTSKLDKHYPYLLSLIRALAPLSGGDACECRTAKWAITAARRSVANWTTQRELRIALQRTVNRVVQIQPTVINRLWQASWWLRTSLVVRR